MHGSQVHKASASEGGPSQANAGADSEIDPTLSRLRLWANWYDKHASVNAIWYRGLKVAQIIAAALVPVVATLSGPAWITAALGSLVVVVEGVQGVFQFHDSWVGYRTAQQSLMREEDLYVARAADYAIMPNAQKLLAERLEQIVHQEQTGWKAARALAAKVHGPAAPISPGAH